jgi:hypothetical protein
VSFEQPIWLLLIAPLAVVLWVWPMPTRLLGILRGLALLLVLLAMAGLAILLPSTRGTVVIVADRSFSMPDDSVDRQTELIRSIHESMRSGDLLGIVSFGERAAIEQAPQSSAFGGFISVVGRDASTLGEGIDAALSLIDPQRPGRIVVLSDGRWTGRDPAAALTRATARDIAIDHRLIERPATGDLAIQRIDAPMQVDPGASFMIHTWLQSSVPQHITYDLRRGGQLISSGERRIPAGLSRLTFRDTAGRPGVAAYQVAITGAEPAADPIPENNSARHLVGVRGARPLLLVNERGQSNLAALLRAAQIDVQTRRPTAIDWSLEGLSSYAGVLIENAPADPIGQVGMANLAAWVRQTGSGLMMTGGKKSYGPGGYFKSPIDPILPVSMELRREHRKFSLAIVVALDRSGSMSMPTPDGQEKMDLANLATAEVLNMLSPMDEFGVVAVDSSAHVIAKLTRLESADRIGNIRNDVLRIESMGGGIFVYTALQQSAGMLAHADAGTRHIILFADAADAEEPGQYKTLLADCEKAGITVTVVGLGKPTDPDADFLRDVATRGNGRIYFTESADALPRLFAQDTFVVARSSFLDEITPVSATAAMNMLTDRDLRFTHPVGGYNLTYLRPGAELAVVTEDEYDAPLIAAWHAGSGRVVCYTGEADGQYTGPIADWPDVGNMFASLARWTLGEVNPLPERSLLTQQVERGVLRVELHLDPQRQREPFDRLPKLSVLRSQKGGSPQAVDLPMRWADADRLLASVNLAGSETVIPTVQLDEQRSVSLPPTCLPYSPEYQPADPDRGREALLQMSRASGGVERQDMAEVWADLPYRSQYIPLAPWLLMTALLVFLLEILERRSGAVSAPGALLARRREALATQERQPVASAARQVRPGLMRRLLSRWRPDKQAGVSTTASDADPTTERPPHPSKAKQPESAAKPEMVDALRRAQQRARGRTRRD